MLPEPLIDDGNGGRDGRCVVVAVVENNCVP
jgi:hypothetical protein